MTMETSSSCLEALGLSSKEAQVYLAMLQLGPAAIQEVACATDIPRATTYMLVNSLKRRGLVMEDERDHRTVFSGVHPASLESLVSDEERRLAEKRRLVEQAMPHFMALVRDTEAKPAVRFFDGPAGERACGAYLVTHHRPHAHILHLAASQDASSGEGSAWLYMDEVLARYPVRRLQRGGEGYPMHPRLQSRQLVPRFPDFFGHVFLFDSCLILRVGSSTLAIEHLQLVKLFHFLFESAWETSVR